MAKKIRLFGGDNKDPEKIIYERDEGETKDPEEEEIEEEVEGDADEEHPEKTEEPEEEPKEEDVKEEVEIKANADGKKWGDYRVDLKKLEPEMYATRRILIGHMSYRHGDIAHLREDTACKFTSCLKPVKKGKEDN